METAWLEMHLFKNQHKQYQNSIALPQTLFCELARFHDKRYFLNQLVSILSMQQFKHLKVGREQQCLSQS